MRQRFVQRDLIYLFLLERRVHQFLGHIAVVGDEQYAETVLVQTSHRIYPLPAALFQQLHHRLVRMGVLHRSHISLGFVHHDIYLAFVADDVPVETHLILLRHLGSEFGHDQSVDRNHTRLDEFIRFTARADTRHGDITVEPYLILDNRRRKSRIVLRIVLGHFGAPLTGRTTPVGRSTAVSTAALSSVRFAAVPFPVPRTAFAVRTLAVAITPFAALAAAIRPTAGILSRFLAFAVTVPRGITLRTPLLRTVVPVTAASLETAFRSAVSAAPALAPLRIAGGVVTVPANRPVVLIEIGIVGFAPRCPFAGRSLRTAVGRISPSVVTVPAVTGTVRATTFASLLVWRPLARTVAALRSVAVAVITAFPAVTPRTGITAAAPVLLRTPVLSVVTGPLGGLVSLTPVIHLFNRPRKSYIRVRLSFANAL